jgi:hypothetical protein
MGNKLKDILGPLGGTLLALLVVPIAIEQYLEVFKESRWILPTSMGIVALCWIIPILFHDRARRVWHSGYDRFGAGPTAIGLVAVAILVTLIFGKMYHLHVHHLESRLNENKLKNENHPTTKQAVEPSVPPSAPPTTVKKGFSSLTFSDSPFFTSQRKARIETEIDAFRGYLQNVGFNVSQRNFTIGVRPGKVMGMVYTSEDGSLEGRIVLGEETVGDSMALRAAYARYYFATTVGSITTQQGMNDQLAMIYEIYFLESYSGSRIAQDSEWNAVLWELRNKFGAKTMDSALLTGLQRRENATRFDNANAYIANVIERGLEPHLNDVKEFSDIEKLFQKHGLMPPPSL